MATTPQKRLILANGEQYVSPVERRFGFGAPLFPRSYADARTLVKAQVLRSLDAMASLPPSKKLGDEIVLTLRLHPDATAKTYDPAALFRTVPDLENVGSRNYVVATKDVAQTSRIKKQISEGRAETQARLIFVRSQRSGFERFLRALDSGEQALTEAFRNDIRRIEHFDLLTAGEQFQAFRADKTWKSGRVELVFHPTNYSPEAQLKYLSGLLKGAKPRGRLNVYPDGPAFVSCVLTADELNQLANVNPLRTAHPLQFGGFDKLRGSPSADAPPPPVTPTRSTIRVGVFDGGVDVSHPYLVGHVEQDEALSVKNTADPDCVAHGTAVVGAILYGALNDHDSSKPLPPPPVSVVSVRVFPSTDPADPDLYEAIDLIESAVPARPDVKFWNVSFGPRGPIWDDAISRFTFALDSLATSHKVGFCVAVGNDGRLAEPWSRIQAPSDLVNGLGVGAFTERRGIIMHAPYSCRGPGRECGKMKPDLVAFGGCDHTPMHLLSITAGKKIMNSGTSFSTPLVTAIGGQAVDVVERGTSLLARTLLIHTARHPSTDPDYLLGHGLVRTTLDGLVRCDDREVTVVFQGDLLASQSVKLPMMLPVGTVKSGRVQITWTVGALPPVSPNHPSDYTTMCIEDTFYPHAQVFPFTNPDPKGKPKVKHLHLIDDAALVAELKRKGWKQSLLPVSESGNIYATEHEKRALDYKWEPVVRRVAGKMATSLHEPFLVLHAIPRHNAAGRVSYAATVTISAPKFEGDLYNAVLRSRPALQPIRLRSEAEIRIKI